MPEKMSDKEREVLNKFIADHKIGSTPEGVFKLIQLAKTLKDDITGNIESRKTREDKIRAEVLGYEKTAQLTTEVLDKLFSEIDAIISQDPNLAVHLANRWDRLTAFVKDEEDTAIAELLRTRTPASQAKTEGDTPEVKRLKFTALKKGVEYLWESVKMFNPKAKLPKEVCDPKTGKLILPSLQGNMGGGGRTSALSSYNVQLAFCPTEKDSANPENYEVMAKGTYPKTAIMRYVNQGDYQITYVEFLRKLRETNQDLFAEFWVLTFPTGTLIGAVPEKKKKEENGADESSADESAENGEEIPTEEQ